MADRKSARCAEYRKSSVADKGEYSTYSDLVMDRLGWLVVSVRTMILTFYRYPKATNLYFEYGIEVAMRRRVDGKSTSIILPEHKVL